MSNTDFQVLKFSLLIINNSILNLICHSLQSCQYLLHYNLIFPLKPHLLHQIEELVSIHYPNDFKLPILLDLEAKMIYSSFLSQESFHPLYIQNNFVILSLSFLIITLFYIYSLFQLAYHSLIMLICFYFITLTFLN